MAPHQPTRRDLLASAAALAAAGIVAGLLRAQPAGKRIGFVDYNLDNFHSNVFLKAFRNQLADRGFVVAGGTAMQVEPSKAWCEKNQVRWFDDVKQLAEQVDHLAVLAPSNPEVHLELCEKTLPLGRRTFVDKTFAPDLKTAERIFALADQHRAPIQTTSSLRYTAVQEHVKKLGGGGAVRHLAVWNPGRLYDEYVIHGVEMAVSCMGSEATRLHRRNQGSLSQLLIDFSGDRAATVHMYAANKTPYAAMITSDKVSDYLTVDTSRLFIDAGAAMLDFFETGRNDVPRAETVTVFRIIDAARRPEALRGYVTL